MKRVTISLVALVLLVQLPLQAQDTRRFVRYQQGDEVYWGELQGETIHRLSDAPYTTRPRWSWSSPTRPATWPWRTLVTTFSA
ncbi:MAG: DUF2437 domain-containing protein [Gemmatimonadota bacterium]